MTREPEGRARTSAELRFAGRALVLDAAGGPRRAEVAWSAAPRLPGDREAIEVLDGLMKQPCGGTIERRPVTEPAIVADVATKRASRGPRRDLARAGTILGMSSRIETRTSRGSLLLAAALLAAPLAARADKIAPEAPAQPVIENTYGFDWTRPERSKCAKVSGALLKKLRERFTCKPPEAGSASGKPIVAVCAAKGKQRGEYLLLGSAADCKVERETQLANGE